MNNQNSLFAWLQESLQRLFAKSPTFFKWWNIINGVLALIAGIPSLLITFDVVLPPDVKWVKVLMNVVAAAATWGFLMSKMTVQRPTVLKTGDVVGPDKETKLPFTEKAEAKQAQKANENP